MTNINVLLIKSGLRGSGAGFEIESMLAGLYGRRYVTTVHVKAATFYFFFIFLSILEFLCLLAAVVATFIFGSAVAGTILAVLAMLAALTIQNALRAYLTRWMFSRALRIAKDDLRSRRFNMLVGVGFGGVVALKLDALLPMVLFAPMQEQYCQRAGIFDVPSLDDTLYATVVHASNDKKVHLDSSIRLVDSAPPGAAKLEIVDDDGDFSNLQIREVRDMIEETFVIAEVRARKVAEAGELNVDLSLFQGNERSAMEAAEPTRTPPAGVKAEVIEAKESRVEAKMEEGEAKKGLEGVDALPEADVDFGNEAV